MVASQQNSVGCNATRETLCQFCIPQISRFAREMPGSDTSFTEGCDKMRASRGCSGNPERWHAHHQLVSERTGNHFVSSRPNQARALLGKATLAHPRGLARNGDACRRANTVAGKAIRRARSLLPPALLLRQKLQPAGRPAMPASPRPLSRGRRLVTSGPFLRRSHSHRLSLARPRRLDGRSFDLRPAVRRELCVYVCAGVVARSSIWGPVSSGIAPRIVATVKPT